jgi:hypothetical protein
MVKEISLYVVITRSIWFKRNTVIHGGIFTHPNLHIQESDAFLEALNIVKKKIGEYLIHYHTKLLLKWNRLPHGWYKINWDMAIDATTRCMGIGII